MYCTSVRAKPQLLSIPDDGGMGEDWIQAPSTPVRGPYRITSLALPMSLNEQQRISP